MSLLIITSTVNVNSCLTVLVDPEIRLQQYITSILFYIKAKNIDSIIGVLYAKDLLAHLNKKTFKWKSLTVKLIISY